jgi:hypothetical protein
VATDAVSKLQYNTMARARRTDDLDASYDWACHFDFKRWKKQALFGRV